MTLVLTHSDIVSLLNRDQVRKAVEGAHAALALGDGHNPAPAAVPIPHGGTALPMAASCDDMTSVKLLCDIPSNRERGLPNQRSTIVVSSAVTGECLAMLDGRAVTAIRTAAASAVATQYLARESASVLGLVGAGNLAVEHAHAIAAVRDITRIVVWSRRPQTVESFRSATMTLGVPVQSVPDARDVFDSADVVCTLTPAREPVVRGSWFRAGQHINAVGAPPRPDHREIDGAGMRRARIVVDNLPTAMAKSGEVLLAIAEGLLTGDDVRTELGQVIAGTAKGRVSDDDVTLFDSVGIGLQDLATAALVIEAAIANGVGTTIDLSA
jgi:alanine dehydrogenase